MAKADYYLCDKCGRKTFYDSEVDYEWGVGDMAVLCNDCALTHTIKIIEKKKPDLSEFEGM